MINFFIWFHYVVTGTSLLLWWPVLSYVPQGEVEVVTDATWVARSLTLEHS